MSDATGAQPSRSRLRRTFYALEVPNYRRYLVAQTTSLFGTWLQFTGQIWLVVEVLAPGDGFMLGVTSAVQSAPILLTLWGGAIADHYNDKRRVLFVTQSLSALIAVTLGVTTLTHVVTLPVVWVCAATLGLVNAADAPARQAMVAEMVDEDHRQSAIALTSMSYQGMRAVGVAAAPVLVIVCGLSAPFLVNAASFLVVLVALKRIDVSALHDVPAKPIALPTVREGLSVLRGNAGLLAPVIALAFLAVFALNFDVTLPLLATQSLHHGLGLTSMLLVISSIGAVLSSLVIAGTRKPSDGSQWLYASVLAVCMCLLALAPNAAVAAVVMFPLGGSIAATTATTNTLLQQRSAPGARGRIMSVYGLVMQGSSLIGGLVIGTVADPSVLGARGGLIVGAAGIVVGLAWSVALLRRDVGGGQPPGQEPNTNGARITSHPSGSRNAVHLRRSQ